MAPAPDSRVGVWHLSAWFESVPPEQRLMLRVEQTSDVSTVRRLAERPAGIDEACASLRRFLEEFVPA